MRSSTTLTLIITISSDHQSCMVPLNTGLRLLIDTSHQTTSIGSKLTLPMMQLRMVTITLWTIRNSGFSLTNSSITSSLKVSANIHLRKFAFQDQRRMQSSMTLTKTITTSLDHQSYTVPFNTGLMLLTDISLQPTSIGSNHTLPRMLLRMEKITPWIMKSSGCLLINLFTTSISQMSAKVMHTIQLPTTKLHPKRLQSKKQKVESSKLVELIGSFSKAISMRSTEKPGCDFRSHGILLLLKKCKSNTSQEEAL